jgi:hypothetical protein
MSSNNDNNILRTLRSQNIGNEGYQPVNYNNNNEEKTIWFTPANICFLTMTVISLAVIVILIIVYK